MSEASGKVGPMTRRRSSMGSARAAAAPYARRGSSGVGSSSTGLTSYAAGMGIGSKDFDEDEDDDAMQVDAKSSSRSTSLAGKALSKAKSFRSGGKKSAAGGSAGAEPQPMEVVLYKQNADDKLGLTFEVPEDSERYKGVVVAVIQPGSRAAGKLVIGDVIHVIDGRAVTTPQEGASYLKTAKGIIQMVVTRANAKPLASSTATGGGASSSSTAAATDADNSQTVVVSCSQLIVESKRIVGSAGGLDVRLDELFSKLKAKTIPSKQALGELIGLVGQTTVEQAGLVIANAASGALPDGWVEYHDATSHKKYYYNVHTKATQWTKPVSVRPVPPPPKMDADDAEDSGDGEEGSSSYRAGGATSSRVAHGVADAIAARATKKKMVEKVQIECSIAPKHGIRGLQSVSL